MKEEWRAIEGYEGLYEVSNLGNVRSVDRHVKDNKYLRLFKSVILKPTEHNGKQSYYYVSLRVKGKTNKNFVHRLVAQAFILNIDKKPQVNHKDGNVHNNCVENLEWVTNAENTQHAYDMKLNIKKQLHITYKNQTKSLLKWCNELGLNYKKTWFRFRKLNWTIERCLEGGD